MRLTTGRAPRRQGVLPRLIGLAGAALLLALAYRSTSFSRLRPSWAEGAPQFAEGCPAAMLEYFTTNYDEFLKEQGSSALKAWLVGHSELVAGADGRTKAVVDVGANMGQIVPTYQGLLNRNSSSWLFMFEAHVPNVGRLQRLAEEVGTASVLNAVIGDYIGTRYFKSFSGFADQHGKLITNTPEEDKDPHPTVKYEEVPATTLDTIFFSSDSEKRGEDFDFVLLKTDTEGWDYKVMLGAQRLLRRVRFYIFECHVLMNKDRGGPGSTHAEIAELLDVLGFDSFKISPRQLVKFNGRFYNATFDTRAHMGWQNCFAMRRTDPLYKLLFRDFNKLQECALR